MKKLIWTINNKNEEIREIIENILADISILNDDEKVISTLNKIKFGSGGYQHTHPIIT